MIKALVITPYEGLVEIVKEVAEEVDDFDIYIKQGNLEEGLAYAREAEEEGFDLIISRGGTSSLIEQHVKIPVVDIQEFGYDILRIMTMVKGFTGKAGIVGFPNITRGASTICNLLDIQVRTMTINHDLEVESKLQELKKDGFEVVIGDVITTEAAKRIGLNGILITSGKEAVLEALEDARRTHRLFSRLNNDLSFYKNILEKDERSIAVLNHDGEWLFQNQTWRSDFIHVDPKEIKEVESMIHQAKQENGEIKKSVLIEDDLWRFSAVTMKETIIFTAERLFNHRLTNSSFENLPFIEMVQEVPFIPISGHSESTQRVLKQIDQCKDIDEPVWIKSEEGNGKELIAQSIYLTRQEFENPFIVIHCHLISDDQLNQLIEEDFFQKVETSVYLRKVDALSLEAQRTLLSLVKQLQHTATGPKWILSSSPNIERLVDERKFDRDLYYQLARYVIEHPPLRERKEDIKNLIQLFISENHSRFGKQVVGVREDALELLIDYDWLGNVDELKQIIEQLVQESESYYIDLNHIQSILNRKRINGEDTVANDNGIKIEGTLEDIERKIIQKVLEEEDMNQSKAAERLGINRTTLWRKLK
ncbi:PrpR N-terminal domain-containing protein [Pontibacillus sp. HMF3514]|uniref:PrpR N-terminal domain-containing protein n=1 Tax=Pontibacillus sp. HMF3514 TaxID=2692425 RepID=UPI00131FBC14|nr:sigma-54-dependent transcriptional regulator [Pontibacillus sp. HMF3514]QHE51651.1 sigma-54-dependent Fis family transcriptional regulator [Pontibacillus sp. HMF3514]